MVSFCDVCAPFSLFLNTFYRNCGRCFLATVCKLWLEVCNKSIGPCTTSLFMDVAVDYCWQLAA